MDGYASHGGRQRVESFGNNGSRVNLVNNITMADTVEEACGLNESGSSTPNVNCIKWVHWQIGILGRLCVPLGQVGHILLNQGRALCTNLLLIMV